MSPGAAVARLAVWVHQRLRAAVDRLAPPELLLAERITGVTGTVVAGALVASGLAERLDDTPRSARELVGDGVLDGDTAERILRGAAAVGLLDLSDAGFRRNRLTRALQPEAPRTLGPLAVFLASEVNLRAWSRFLEAVCSGEVPFRRAHGRSVWEHLASSEEDGARFARAMDSLTRLDAEAVVRTPPFSGVAGLSAYVLKDVLHDWDDARAVDLLTVVRRAMPAGARLLLVELLLEKGPVAPLASLVDLQMLAFTDGGRQRSAEELAALLGRAGFGPPVVHRTRTASSVLVSEAV